MDDKPFRVLLDFSEIQPDTLPLKYVWMYVSPRELKTIGDLKQAIIKKFSFSCINIKLFVRDGLLLETERIAVLRDDDTVKIQEELPYEPTIDISYRNVSQEISDNFLLDSATNSKESQKRKSDALSTLQESDCSLSKKRKQDRSTGKNDSSKTKKTHSLNVSQQLELSQSKRKIKSSESREERNNKDPILRNKKQKYSQTPTSEFISLAMKLNQKETVGYPFKIYHDESKQDSKSDKDPFKTTTISNVSSHLTPEINLETMSKISTNQSESYYSSICQDTANGSDSELVSSKNNCGKKKRRKRKKRQESLLSQDSNMSVCATELDSMATIDAGSDTNYLNTRKHIIFHSPSPPKTSNTVTLNQGSDSNLDQSRDLNIKDGKLIKDFDNISSTQDTSLQSFECGSKCDSMVSQSDEFKQSTPFSKKKKKNQSWGVTPLLKISNKDFNTSAVDENYQSIAVNKKTAYQDCTPLNCLPPVGTRLVYKTLELNEQYCPEVTQYKEGILTKIDPNTDELEIELIQEEVQHSKSGKFENVWKDDQPPDDQVIKKVTLSWSALIEPRLITE